MLPIWEMLAGTVVLTLLRAATRTDSRNAGVPRISEQMWEWEEHSHSHREEHHEQGVPQSPAPRRRRLAAESDRNRQLHALRRRLLNHLSLPLRLTLPPLSLSLHPWTVFV